MAALILAVLLGMASLAIDLGQLYVVRNDLQNTADATALAGAANLINPQNGLRDASVALQAVFTVAQRQSQVSGLPEAAPGDRNDLTITFGEWNVRAGDPQTAWTEIGSTCSSDSNANAVKTTIRRGSGTIYGPVSNFFARIFGINTSEVQASAIAYIGFTQSMPTGGVPIPLALPSTVLTASKGRSGWFAKVLGPNEAVASTTKTYVFRDTAGAYVNTTVTTASPLDPNQAYLFTVGQSDAVPGTIWNILEKIYTPSKTGSILYVTDLTLGQRIYARSEFKYGTSYITPIFQRIKKAYNYRTTGNANTSPPAGTPWRVTFPVYGTTANPVIAQHPKTGFQPLARLLAFLGPSAAYACYTMPPPNIYVNGFVNADITDATYSSTADNCSYTYPKTIYGVTYTDKKDCLTRYPSSVWNKNTVTIENVTDASTVSPPGSLSGGYPNQDLNPGAPENVGAYASIPRLVK
jgi:Flp pilus assembly protein TadG